MLTLYYDDTCKLCTTNALTMVDKNPRCIRIVSVNEGLNELESFGISRTYAMTFVCVLNHDTKTMLSGMSAIRLLFEVANVKYAKLLHLPLIKQFTHLTYPILAKNRYRFPNWLIKLCYGNVASEEACSNGMCKLPPHKR